MGIPRWRLLLGTSALTLCDRRMLYLEFLFSAPMPSVSNIVIVVEVVVLLPELLDAILQGSSILASLCLIDCFSRSSAFFIRNTYWKYLSIAIQLLTLLIMSWTTLRKHRFCLITVSRLTIRSCILDNSRNQGVTFVYLEQVKLGIKKAEFSP